MTFLILGAIFFTFVRLTNAATPTPPNADITNQIDELKTKIASKVAELNLVEKRGIVGTVTDSSDTQITVTDINGQTRIIDVDEITKFSSSNSKTFGISDIKKGSYLGILGLYNKQSQRILARDINELAQTPKIIFGGISYVDGKNYELTVIKENEEKVIVEITDLTRTLSYSSGDTVKSGFSKIKATNTVFAIGYPDKNDTNKLSATRLIILPDIDLTSRINLSLPQATIPPSTGSGVKLYPIK